MSSKLKNTFPSPDNTKKLGLSIVPISPGGKRPIGKWKQFMERFPTDEELQKWIEEKHERWAIITGKISGVYVVDLDVPEGLKWVEEWGIKPHVKTPSGGYHLYLSRPKNWPESHIVGCMAWKSKPELAKRYPGLDLRADGGLAVFQGEGYKWLRPFEPDPLDTLPQDVILFLGLLPCKKDVLLSRDHSGEGQTDFASLSFEELVNWALDLIPIVHGRNNAGFELARKMKLLGIKKKNAKKVMQEYCRRTGELNSKGQKEPYPMAEANASLESAYKFKSTHQTTLKNEYYQPTELGNADRFTDAYEQEIHYCPIKKTWYFWDGMRWKKDEILEVHRKGIKVIREIESTVGKSKMDNGMKSQAQQHALRSQSYYGLSNMLKLVMAHENIAVAPDKFDQDPWLLNCLNGTLDLRTGKLFDHNPKQHISKLCNAKFKPSAKCPKWLKFLDRIMNGNKPLIHFLQRSLGYCLCGDTSEQKIWIFYGQGSNGKSTLMSVIGDLLGDYSHHMSPEAIVSFKTTTSNTVNAELADLQGARFVETSESDDGKSLSESTVQRLTGNEKMRGRFLHENPFTFRPECKIFFSTNHKPVIKGTNHAIWRRIVLIPFEVKIPDEEQDKELYNKLALEFEGILAWLWKGFHEWNSGGLKPPEAVTYAVDSYRAEMDVLRDFIEECCYESEPARVQSLRLYNCYRDWAEKNGFSYPMTHPKFSKMMKERGYRNEKATSGEYKNLKVFYGIGLKSDEPIEGSAGMKKIPKEAIKQIYDERNLQKGRKDGDPW